MKFKLTLLVFIMIGATASTQAQELSKTEKKALKKEIRGLIKNPAKYKTMKENLTANEQKVAEQGRNIGKLQRSNNELQQELLNAKQSISSLNDYVSSVKEAKNTCREDNGMQYRVQIGAYAEFDIRSFLHQTKVVSFEEVDNLYRYSIGNFATKEEAISFRNAIKKMGIKDAFITYYLNGERTPNE